MVIISAIIAYFIGFPYGFIAGNLFMKVDLRRCGSGNLGATNTLRVLGKKAGIAVLVADMLKGVVVVWLLPLIFWREGGSIGRGLVVVIVGAAGIAGHNWPVLLKFEGGKGVAVTIGVFLAIAPLSTLCALALFIIVAAGLRYISLASIVFALSLPVLIWLFRLPVEYVCLAVLAMISMLFQHRRNIRRLLEGTESKLGSKASSREMNQ